MNGVYRYTGGWNLEALAATGIGLVLAWGGYVIPALNDLTDHGWFVGFFAAGLSYRALARAFPTSRPRVARRFEQEPA